MGCSATGLFDGLHFVGFYCLPAFVGEQQQQQQPPHHLLLLLLTPVQTTNPASRESVQRAAAEDAPEAGGSTHAGLGDSEAASATAR